MAAAGCGGKRRLPPARREALGSSGAEHAAQLGRWTCRGTAARRVAARPGRSASPASWCGGSMRHLPHAARALRPHRQVEADDQRLRRALAARLLLRLPEVPALAAPVEVDTVLAEMLVRRSQRANAQLLAPPAARQRSWACAKHTRGAAAIGSAARRRPARGSVPLGPEHRARRPAARCGRCGRRAPRGAGCPNLAKRRSERGRGKGEGVGEGKKESGRRTKGGKRGRRIFHRRQRSMVCTDAEPPPRLPRRLHEPARGHSGRRSGPERAPEPHPSPRRGRRALQR